jgi:hypothetical protein
MKKQNIQEIETDSIHLAAYLIIRKIPLLRIARSGRLGIFYFHAEKASPELAAYMSCQAAVEPKAFVSAIRQLKMQIDECPSEFGRSYDQPAAFRKSSALIRRKVLEG